MVLGETQLEMSGGSGRMVGLETFNRFQNEDHLGLAILLLLHTDGQKGELRRYPQQRTARRSLALPRKRLGFDRPKSSIQDLCAIGRILVELDRISIGYGVTTGAR